MTLDYKNFKNEKIEFQISNHYYSIKFKKEDKEKIKSKVKVFILITEDVALIKDELSSLDFSINKSIIKNKLINQLISVEPVLIYKDGIKEICNGELIIKFKNKGNIDKYFKNYTFQAQEDNFVENQYLIKLEGVGTEEIFQIVEVLNADNNVEFAEPNFYKFLKPHTNDTFFSSQWSIDNQGYLGGTVDADMDVKEAWSISTGDGVKIAILDLARVYGLSKFKGVIYS